MINITVNNKSHQFETEISLQEVVSVCNISITGIAIAVNQEVVSKSDWSSHQIKDKDSILVIKATQGG